MANYHCVVRSNYFHVKDPKLFRQFMARVYGVNGTVELWEEKDDNGQTVFAFGSYGGIGGVRVASEDVLEDADETAYDEFIYGLQQNIRADDAVIILESGHEKLRCLIGSAEIITCNEYDQLDISELARRHAGFMLDNPAWETKFQD